MYNTFLDSLYPVHSIIGFFFKIKKIIKCEVRLTKNYDPQYTLTNNECMFKSIYFSKEKGR